MAAYLCIFSHHAPGGVELSLSTFRGPHSPGVGKQPPVLDVPVSLCFEFWEAIKSLRCERSKLPGPGLHRAIGNEGQVEENTTANPDSHGHGVGGTKGERPSG